MMPPSLNRSLSWSQEWGIFGDRPEESFPLPPLPPLYDESPSDPIAAAQIPEPLTEHLLSENSKSATSSSAAEEASPYSSRVVKKNRKATRVARTNHVSEALLIERKERNRASAKQSRDEKKQLVANLTRENGALKAEIESLKAEIEALKEQLKIHAVQKDPDYDNKVQSTFMALLAQNQMLSAQNQSYAEYFAQLKAVLKKNDSAS